MASVLDTDKASLMAPRPSVQRTAAGTSSGQGDAFRKTLGTSNATSQDKPADQASPQAETSQTPKTASRHGEASSKSSRTAGSSRAAPEEDKAGTNIFPADATATPDEARTSGPAEEDLPASLLSSMSPVSETEAGEKTDTALPADHRPHPDVLAGQAVVPEAAAAQSTVQVSDAKAGPHPDAVAAGVKTDAPSGPVEGSAADPEETPSALARADALTSAGTAATPDLPAESSTGRPAKAAAQSLPGSAQGSVETMLPAGGQLGSDLIQKTAEETGLHKHDARAPTDPAFPMTSLADAIDQKATGAAMLTGDATRALTGTEGGLQALHGQAPSLMAAPATPALSAPPATQAMAAAQPQATLVAAPEEIVDILSQKPSRADGRDRIMVQLDPPELGRISLDFKFDGQGLQHVTVTGETPEAMRRMRMMHNELVQALEQHGLSGKDMSFQEQSQRQWNSQNSRSLSDTGIGETADTLAASAVPLKPALTRITSSGLDIRL